ncbi:MAG: prepilin-type N-terminal cleavage/methylation domain-containing protein, partial [Cyanobacteriota bacterium]|nr:prepilin-type N-terminal cleavage/methylation domain-containing protein [Cyanobacteriota bacterium]
MLCLDNRQTYKDIMIKKAFTLSELLIALGVIAILTAISMPIIHNLLPDQNVVMAKRAFYTT